MAEKEKAESVAFGSISFFLFHCPQNVPGDEMGKSGRTSFQNIERFLHRGKEEIYKVHFKLLLDIIQMQIHQQHLPLRILASVDILNFNG